MSHTPYIYSFVLFTLNRFNSIPQIYELYSISVLFYFNSRVYRFDNFNLYISIPDSQIEKYKIVLSMISIRYQNDAIH